VRALPEGKIFKTLKILNLESYKDDAFAFFTAYGPCVPFNLSCNSLWHCHIRVKNML